MKAKNPLPFHGARMVVASLGFLLLTAGCGQGSSGGEDVDPAPDAPLLDAPAANTLWVLRELYGREVPEIQGNSLPELQFDEAGGRFVGSTGCNHIHGNLVQKESGALAFEGSAQSLRACADMGLEDGFKQVLSETRYFNEQAMELDFLNEEKKVIARFTGRPMTEKN